MRLNFSNKRLEIMEHFTRFGVQTGREVKVIMKAFFVLFLFSGVLNVMSISINGTCPDSQCTDISMNITADQVRNSNA
jgi:hypothetical protein